MSYVQRKTLSFKSSHCSCGGLLECDNKAEDGDLKLCCWQISILVGTGMNKRLSPGRLEHDWCFDA
jgi:hypothetical protein